MLLLTKEQTKLLSEKLDNSLTFDEWVKGLFGKALEALDGPVSLLVLNGLNNKISDHIPDDYKLKVQAAFDDVFDGDQDYDEAIENAISILNELKDLLNVSDEVKYWIDAALNMLCGVLTEML
jgi:hypothetical protein